MAVVDRHQSRVGRLVRRFLPRKTAILGAALVLFVVAGAVFAPILAPYPPNQTVARPTQPPSREHPLGTDEVGRDLLSRTIYGARASLMVGVGAQLLSATIGVLLGTISGYYGGRKDMVLMRIVDTFMAFPFILLAILFVAALGPNTQNVILAIGLTAWTTTCRIVRGQTLSLREEAYIEAARSIGASNWRILGVHVLPNVVPITVIMFTLGIGSAILAESSLSFLGLGIQPPTASWGKTLAFGQVVIFTAPYLSIVPTFAILITVLGFNLFGDGLRDALDPRESTFRGQIGGR
ncbi:MAG: ABC transporter permease [Chloroflexota bacterium]|nr:ABC transporter permease [Chloroflexota bacterium]